METVAIVGVGLIGASFGLALKNAGFKGKILGVSSPRALKEALERGAIDEQAALEDAAARADLVYLSQPICRILETLAALDPWLRPDSLVTDAGSTKARIVEQAGRSIRRAQFLGGHPMAGKEKRGAGEADGNLFAGRTYVLTPSDPSELETPAAREFVRWIGRIGAAAVTLSPQEHDRVVALTSHLPQLLSTALASLLAERAGQADHLKVAGPGLMDMTRLAASSFEIWSDILRTNGPAIEEALAACIRKLESYRAGITSGSMGEEFEKAGRLAGRLRGE